MCVADFEVHIPLPCIFAKIMHRSEILIRREIHFLLQKKELAKESTFIEVNLLPICPKRFALPDSSCASALFSSPRVSFFSPCQTLLASAWLYAISRLPSLACASSIALEPKAFISRPVIEILSLSVTWRWQ